AVELGGRGVPAPRRRRRARRAHPRAGAGDLRLSGFRPGGVPSRVRDGPAGPAGPRAAARAPRAGCPDLRADAGPPVPPGPAGRRGDAPRIRSGGGGGRRRRLVGGPLAAVPAAPRRPGQLHRAHGSRARAPGRDRVDRRGGDPRSATVAPLPAHDPRFLAKAVRDLHRMFPSFRDVPIEAGWGGPIDVAGTYLPFFGTLASGNVHYGLGFTGNGVGPCHLGGQILASLALHADDGFTRLAVVRHEPLRFPPEPFRSPGMLLVNEAIRRKDDAEDEGRSPGPLVDFVARIPRRMGYNLGPR